MCTYFTYLVIYIRVVPKTSESIHFGKYRGDSAAFPFLLCDTGIYRIMSTLLLFMSYCQLCSEAWLTKLTHCKLDVPNNMAEN